MLRIFFVYLFPMNTVQIIDRTLFWCDKVRAPRFERQAHILPAINVGIDDFIKDRYDNIKQANQDYFFEVPERVRGELYSLIVDDLSIAPPFGGTTILQPLDYMYELNMSVMFDGLRVRSEPLRFNDRDTVITNRNSFTQPSKSNVYHAKTGTGYKFNFGTTGNFTAAILSYLKQQIQVVRSETIILAGANVLTVGATYYVNAGPVNQPGVVYTTGQTFVATQTNFTGAGSVFLIVNTELPPNTHEEIAKRAAEILMNTADDRLKIQTVKAQVQAQ